jgi:phosphatidylglycerol:prolipoprotein diacylglycerol transferase
VRPFLFTIGDFGIPSYWILVLVGAMIALWFAWREEGRAGISAGNILELGLVAMLAGLVGARGMAAIAGGGLLRPSTGLYLYGGLVLAVPAVAFWARARGLGVGRVLDLAAVSTCLGLSIGRLGCWLTGCCHGAPTGLPWGVTFTDAQSLARPLDTPLHPTQLYEAGLAFMLFFFLWVTRRRALKFDGQVFLVFVVLYSAGRFLIEFFRNDNQGLLIGRTLTLSQLVALPLVLTALILLVILRRRASARATG